MLYCPKCKINILESGQVTDLLHDICGCRTVPLWSEEKRKRLRAEERIEGLTEELDAECRISQMLLADKKKQDKRIEGLEDENRRMRKALQSWIDVNRGAPNKYNWAKQALVKSRT